ncbi:CAP-associated domain-containing protein [Enterococcus florum]|nr:CAP-associated domain-containing protein [Enterococcus florum]
MIGFLSIFIIVLIGYYVQPIIFPPKPAEPSPVEQQNRPATHKSIRHETIQTEGYAQYVDQPLTEVEMNFGEPARIEQSGFFYETRIYPLEKGSLEVNIEEGTVVSINMFSAKSESAPFTFGMTNQQLAQQMSLSANFAVSYDEEPVDIELSEEDMRYRPLIAFDNGTFAIAFFDAKKDRLLGLSYMNIEMLLRLMPYQINSGNPLSFLVQESELDWMVINQQKAQRLTEVVNFFRRGQKLPAYSFQTEKESHSQKLLDDFLSAPEDLLSDERHEEWLSKQSARLNSMPFSLRPEELDQLKKINGLAKDPGLFYSPVIDPTFTVFQWLTQNSYHEFFSDQQQEQIDVAFNHENVLVLLQEANQTKDSD